MKALELFEKGAVKKVSKNKWTVQGTRLYHVKKLDPWTWNCTCEDHLYRLENCKHIRAAMKDDQKESIQEKFFNNKLKDLKMKERAINEQIQKIINLNREHFRKYNFKDDSLRKMHHRLHNKLLEVQEEIKKNEPAPRTVTHWVTL